MLRMNKHTSVALLAGVTLLFAACGDDSESAGDASSADLAGRTFLSTDASTFDIVDGTVISMSFEADTLGVQAGCNNIAGGYTIADGVLQADNLLTTEMACDDALMDQDQRVVELLTSDPAIAVDGTTLTIGSGDISLVLEEQQPAELEGTTWNVTGVVANDGVSSVPAGATVTFADGEVQFTSGCNTGFGPAVVEGDTIEFGALGLTKMACEDDVMALESAMTTVMAGTVTVEIEGDTLRLTNGDNGLVLTAA
jgi:heat shock protein HslJ